MRPGRTQIIERPKASKEQNTVVLLVSEIRNDLLKGKKESQKSCKLLQQIKKNFPNVEVNKSSLSY